MRPTAPKVRLPAKFSDNPFNLHHESPAFDFQLLFPLFLPPLRLCPKSDSICPATASAEICIFAGKQSLETLIDFPHFIHSHKLLRDFYE
jgi:hypothetical protein